MFWRGVWILPRLLLLALRPFRYTPTAFDANELAVIFLKDGLGTVLVVVGFALPAQPGDDTAVPWKPWADYLTVGEWELRFIAILVVAILLLAVPGPT
jgi:hypothetical protein